MTTLVSIKFKSGREIVGDMRTVKEHLTIECDKLLSDLSKPVDYRALSIPDALKLGSKRLLSTKARLESLRLHRDLHDLIQFHTHTRSQELTVGLNIEVLERATLKTFEI